MNKKSIVVILIIIVLLLIIGFMAFNEFSNSQNQIKIGNTTFTLPEGFHEGASNKAGDKNITNGYDTYFLKKYGDDNITKYIKQYTKDKEKDNNTVHTKKFTVNDTVVYKTSLVNKTNAVRYWFNYNGEVYAIYTWHGNTNTDKIVTDIISSLN